MIRTLKESKAKLSDLVAAAANGEDVIIPVHGKPKVRLSPVIRPPTRDPGAWARQLRALHRACATGRRATDGTAILDDLRAERA